VASLIINVRVELELDRALRAQARQQGVKLSELVRVILRQGAGVCDLRESGYREGKILGYGEVRKKLDSAFEDVPATLNGLKNDR
jgi:hypothetical protein